MNEIQAVEAVMGSAARAYAPSALTSPQMPSTSFSQLVANGVGEVNRQLLDSQQGLQTLALGDAQNLHQVMIRLEESKLTFQLMLQVRNRLLESYQDIMKMQI